MKKSLSLTMYLTLMLLCLGFMEASAQAPNTISYQGRLTQLDGTPITSANSVIFSIYDVSSGGVALQVDTISVDPDDNGIFTVELGPIDIAVFDGGKLYLGIQVGNDSEMTPRQVLTSAPYSMATEQVEDTSITTAKLTNDAVTTGKIAAGAVGNSDLANNAVTTGKISNGTILMADIGQNSASSGDAIKWNGSAWAPSADNNAGGDITGVTASGGLTGGGVSGTVNLSVATSGITADHIAANAVAASEIAANAVGASEIATNGVAAAEIADGTVGSAEIATGAVFSSEIADYTISNIDINNSAAISTSKISGTAVNLSSHQTITSAKTYNTYRQIFNAGAEFNNTCYFQDSTMTVSINGISIGDNTISSSYLLRVERDPSTTSSRYGVYSYIDNASTGIVYGMYANADNSDARTNSRYGIRAYAGNSSNTGGSSYGARSTAYGGVYAYGFYGYASGATYNYGGYFYEAKEPNSYAGYFEGDVEATGFSSTGSGGIKIDHPLDPTGKYLFHSHIESPDMLNVYSGNVTTDGDGSAIVELPDYFETLNKDFRYQLTVIGAFAQAIIGSEIFSNSFSIKTDKPYIKVSWQVSGIRTDPYAETYRVSPEVDKPSHEVGLYLHPEARGISDEQSIHYEARRQAELDDEQAEADRIANENQP